MLHNWRCFETLTIKPSNNIVWLFGLNGSGKTSILEAVYFSTRARSFKEPQPKNLITRSKKDSGVLLEIGNSKKLKTTLNEKGLARVTYKGEIIKSRSTLLNSFSTTFISPNVSSLLLGTPKTRRNYILWLLFHVKPQLYNQYSKMLHIIKQRNALLRKQKLAEIHKYTKELQSIDLYLSTLISDIEPKITKQITAISETATNLFSQLKPKVAPIKLKTTKGWNKEKTIQMVLEGQYQTDIKRGFTQAGLHKFDFGFSDKATDVKKLLSSGELKVLSMCLVLSAHSFIEKDSNKISSLLIDDIASELDQQSLESLLSYLTKTKQTIILTSTTEPPKQYQNQVQLFHVEHG